MMVAEFSDAWGVDGGAADGGADDFTVWCDVPVEESAPVIEMAGAQVRGGHR